MASIRGNTASALRRCRHSRRSTDQWVSREWRRNTLDIPRLHSQRTPSNLGIRCYDSEFCQNDVLGPRPHNLPRAGAIPISVASKRPVYACTSLHIFIFSYLLKFWS